MKRFASLLAFLIALPSLFAAEAETDLIALLQSRASGPEKSAACYQLRLTGTVRCVPALAALLTEEAVSHAARHALEGLPFPEAGDALRAALATTSGRIKAGVIDSLGWRGEPASVPLLVPLLKDPQPEIAAAAAAALGRLATPEAARALAQAREGVDPIVQPAVQEGMLRAADQLAADHPDLARELYLNLYEDSASPEIRAAAGRGLVLARPELLSDPEVLAFFREALTGPNRFLREAALAVLRETTQAGVAEHLLSAWADLPPDAQVAVQDACQRLGVNAAATARRASQSPVSTVRLAAWQALAELNDLDSIPALIRVAVAGDPEERKVARESLQRLRGEGVLEALKDRLENADPATRVELLRLLGERGDPGAAAVLLRQAAGTGPTRSAALESLARLATPTVLPGLLELAARSQPGPDAEPLVQALIALCEASPNPEQTARLVTDAVSRFEPPARRALLPLLPELGTAAALELALAAAGDRDRDTQKEAIEILGQWPGAAPTPQLLDLAQQAGEPTLQILALRSAVQTLGHEPNAAVRLDWLKRALSLARRAEEKRLVLARLGEIPAPESLALLAPNLADPDLAEEAGVAAVAVAEQLAATHPQLARETAASVLAVARNAETLRRAWALRGETIQPGPFINQWLVSGPYRQPGVQGAVALFDLPFGPEKPGEPVAWRAVRGADLVPLSSLFPGQTDCVTYLKSRIVSPRKQEVLLLMGSDDGIQVWLNGQVVHAHNTDRGWVADQDAARVPLAPGTNELMLKITQGGGGWAVSARFVGTDGRPLPDLQIVPAPADIPDVRP